MADGFAGLFEGLAKGLGTGFQLGQRNRLLEIQEKQAAIEQTAQFSQRLLDFSKMDPDLRKHVGPDFFKQFEKAFDTRLDDTVKKSLIAGDQFAPAIYQYVAAEMKKGTKWQDIMMGLTAKDGDWQKKISILENVYGKFYQPEKKLELETRQTRSGEISASASAQNAVTNRMNAETSRMAHTKDIVAGEIFKDVDTTLKNGGVLSDQQLSRAKLAGLSLGLKADEALNFQINTDVPTLGLTKGQTVLAFRDKSDGSLFVVPPGGKPVRVPSTFGIEVGKPTEVGTKYMHVGNQIIRVDPGTNQGVPVFTGPKEIHSIPTNAAGQLRAVYKDGTSEIVDVTRGTTSVSKDTTLVEKGTLKPLLTNEGPKEAKGYTFNQTWTDPKSGATIGKGERVSGIPSKDGKTVTVQATNDQGKVVEIQVPSGDLVPTTVQAPSAARESQESFTKLKNQTDAVDLGIKDAVTLQRLVLGGMKTGTAATWQRFLQSSVGQSKQFLGFVDALRKDSIRGDRLDSQYEKFFDSRLPTAQLLQNALVYRYASILSPGNERVPVEMLKQVSSTLGFTEGWANDPKTAEAKIAQVIRQLTQTKSALQKRLKEETRSPLRSGADFDATKE